MAIIGKIRERTGLLLAFIGIALFIFVIQAGLEQSNLFNTGVRKSLGKIAGKKVKTEDYVAMVNEYNDRVKVLNPNLEFTDENQQAIRDEVWTMIITDRLLSKTFDELGLNVSKEELAENFKGQFIHPVVMNFFESSFRNEQTGQFDKAQFTQALSQMDQVDPSGKFRKLVSELEFVITQDRIRTKYASLIGKASYVPDFIAKENIEGNKSTTAEIVSLPYTLLEDKEFEVTDEEVEQYMKKRPNQFKQNPARVLDIVLFNITMSGDDLEELKKNMYGLMEEFKTTKEDSLFMVRNTLQGSNVEYLTLEELKSRGKVYADSIAIKPIGSFVGPVMEGTNLISTKIVDRKIIPDSVRASHILLRYTSAEDRKAKLALADSIIAETKAGRLNFPQKAFEISEDPGSKQKGGDLGFFPKGAMVPEFNNKVFYDMKVGDVDKVESQFGLHIIVKTGEKGGKPATRIADLALELGPSDATVKKIYEQAYAFWQSANTPETFDKNAKNYSLQKGITVRPSDGAVAGLKSSRRVVSWAFQQKDKGAIQFFDLDDSYAIVKVSGIKEEGMMPVSEVKEMVADKIMNEKKAAKLKEQLEAATKGNVSLEAVAQKLKGRYFPLVTIQYASDYVDNIGTEPKLVGTAFGTPSGKVSKPVSGETGVYVVKPGEFIKPDMPFEASLYKRQMARTTAQRVNFMTIIESIKDKAQIKDERYYLF
jgi:peptidyl-prolyl cis-trans isomerase D